MGQQVDVRGDILHVSARQAGNLLETLGSARLNQAQEFQSLGSESLSEGGDILKVNSDKQSVKASVRFKITTPGEFLEEFRRSLS